MVLTTSILAGQSPLVKQCGSCGMRGPLLRARQCEAMTPQLGQTEGTVPFVFNLSAHQLRVLPDHPFSV